MQKSHLKFLACPTCKGDLSFSEISQEKENRIKEGLLKCQSCKREFLIKNFIPRFVPLENYASSFGFEWMTHSKTQYDSYNGTNISKTRFFTSTKWPQTLHNQLMLEAGSGAGRFTEIAASTGAMVISLDYSYAVDANYASNGRKDNVLIVQGDIYAMPFKEGIFDKVFCFGVLQHTPDVEKAFLSLPRYLKQGGSIAVDVYRKYGGIVGAMYTKHWIRPLTRKFPPHILYNMCKKYVQFMWPFARIINRLSKYGRYINRGLLIADYGGMLDLPDNALREWAILDTYDMLSPRYDSPQTRETLKKWFKKAGLARIDVGFGWHGIEGRGVKS